MTLRLLAIAINNRRLGYVFFTNNHLQEWRTLQKATFSEADAACSIQELIRDLKPTVVVLEDMSKGTQKSRRIQKLNEALQRTAAHNYVLDICITRPKVKCNRYEYAAELAEIYPELLPWVPAKRRIFDNECAHMAMFEALALAHKVLERPSSTLAAGMG